MAHCHKSLTFCISGDVISFRGSLGNEYFLESKSDKGYQLKVMISQFFVHNIVENMCDM